MPTVAFRISGLKLYALVLLIYSFTGPILEYGDSIIRYLFTTFSVHLLISIVLMLMPFVGAIFLIKSRDVTAVLAVLIVLGISYLVQVVNLFTYISFVFKEPGLFSSPWTILNFGLPIFFAIWTWNVYQAVSRFEDS